MIRHILGKHQSMNEFSDIDFSELDSVGLNEAAIIFNTRYAMTGHGCIMPKYEGRKIIVTYPSFEGEDFRNHEGVIDYIWQGVPSHIMLREPESVGSIQDVMLCAINKVERAYPNYWTVLHLGIFHAIFKGYRRIFVYGCNHEQGSVNGYEEGRYYEYMETHTEKIIKAGKALGVEIVRFKSRKEYDSYITRN